MYGAFCARCGQRAVPPHPSIREFVGEAFAELTGWDGKFVETFKLLLAKPGAVTRQFIEGRRVRFISPVRLYLWMSLIYFVVAAAAPDLAPPGMQSTFSVGAGTGADVSSPPSRDSIAAAVARAPRWLTPIVRRGLEDPKGMKRSMLENMPRVVFVLLPIFALILDVFYRRYRYPAHLYFSIHFHTLVFMVLAVAEVAKFTHAFYFAAAVTIAAQLAIPLYAVIALRGMYGGGYAATMAKAAGIAVIYLSVWGGANLALAYYAAVAR